MAQPQLGVVLRHIHRLVDSPSTDEPSDGQLLDRFIASRDEVAFEELLRRHGPMVYGICRRLLGTAHDADDAFQATFLLLVHKATSIRKGTSLGCWLYGVAYRLSLKARTAAARRRVHERRVANMRPVHRTSEPSWNEVRPLLDEELARLPERLRAPLVLCYLQGKTNVQAARELGQPAGSMSKLLARGRDVLRQRLTRRGVALPGTELGLLLAEHTRAAVPAGLGRATLEAGLAMGAVSARVAGLVRWGMRDMCFAKCKIVLALVFTLGLLGAGTSLLSAPPPPPAEAPPVAAEEEQPAAEQPPAPKAGVDAQGDPLPPGALARFGTLRLRHGYSVQGIAFAPDGKSLVSAAPDHLVRQWEVPTGREIGTFGQQNDRDKPFAPSRWLHAVAFSPDGKTLATGDHNDGWQLNTIRLWDVASHTQTRIMQGHTDGILSLAWSADGKTLASASNDGTVRLWDPDNGSERRTLSGHQGAVRCVVWSRDGKQLATAGADGTVRLWDPDKGTELRSITAHEGVAYTVAFAPDAKSLVSGGADNTVRKWDAVTGKEAWSVKRDKAVRAVTFSSDGKLVAYGSGPGVTLCDPGDGHEVRRLNGPHNEVFVVAFSSDAEHVAAASGYNSVVFLWEAATGKRLGPQAGHEASHVTRLAYSADGRMVTTGSADQTLRQWDPATGRQVRLLNTPETAARAACLSPDGRSLACVTWAGHLRIMDLAGKELHRWKAHTGQITVVTYSPDAKLIASAGVDRAVVLWDPATGKEVRRFELEQGPPNEVTFSPDGQLLCVVVRGQAVSIWEVAEGKRRFLVPPAPGPNGGGVGSDVESAEFSPDGRLLATGGRDGFARLWDVATGQQLREFPGHLGWILAVRFSPDGRTLAVGCWRKVRLWEVTSGKLRKELSAHEADVTAVAFAPDARTLTSAGGDTTALVWDLTGRLQERRLRLADLSQRDLELAWADLRGDDAARAYAALWVLASAPKQALPLLRDVVRRADAVDSERIAKLIAGLDDDDFDKREKATEDLLKVGEQARPLVKKTLEAKPAAELRRRLEYLLERMQGGGDSGERLQQDRVLELLEVMATPEARAVLDEVARGAPDAWQTREAKAALTRMRK
jgi:RNA polymerase sigma factor (sigma-70 family)